MENTIYLISADQPADERFLARFLPLVSQSRAERTARLRNGMAKKTGIYGEVTARCALRSFEHLHRLPEPAIGENGKPYFPDMPGVHFNISHKGRFAAVALSSRPVGIDIENTAVPGMHAIKKFTPSESEWVLRQDSEIRFAVVWTRKEAYLKYTGAGLTRPLDSVDVLSGPESGRIWTKRHGELMISVCGEALDGFPRIEILGEDELEEWASCLRTVEK